MKKEINSAYGQMCRECSKIRHFAFVCRNGAAKDKQLCQLEDGDLLVAKISKRQRQFWHTKVGGHINQFLLDRGPAVNLLLMTTAQ